jgi:DNA-binding transcriptional LysR family regulator
MTKPDYNLLLALDVLLTEGSVARAGRRLGLSSSAMSRALARLREMTGDPLLVRAGRGLVPTPRAVALREQVPQLVHDVEAVLRPAEAYDLGRVSRTFTLRTSDGFVENFGAALLTLVKSQAPGVRLRFLQKLSRESAALRDGSVDLETGVIDGETGPEVRVRALFRDRFVGAMRAGHPLTGQAMTAQSYARAGHVLVSRRGAGTGWMDQHLRELGLERNIVTSVDGFASALALARGTELVATVPDRHTGHLRVGMESFALPFFSHEITVNMMWHPRMDADPLHRWLRNCVFEVCSV